MLMAGCHAVCQALVSRLRCAGADPSQTAVEAVLKRGRSASPEDHAASLCDEKSDEDSDENETEVCFTYYEQICGSANVLLLTLCIQ